MGTIFRALMPYIAVILLQLGYGGNDILSKLALNRGMSSYIYVVLRQAIATVFITPLAIIFERSRRPKMTLRIFIKILMLGIVEPVMNQNLFLMGMKYTTATFAASMTNMVPALTFLIASISRVEKMKLKRRESQSKIIGTMTTLTGAMVMTLVKGPIIFQRTKGETSYNDHDEDENHHNNLHLDQWVKGGIMISIGCLCESAFVILQGITLKSYPAELTLTAWICSLGATVGALLPLIMERNHLASSFSIKFDAMLLAASYSGIICSGVAYFIQGLLMKTKGPIFATAFNPLSMIFVAIVSFCFLDEPMTLERVHGAIIIVLGLYLVIWGMSRESKKISTSEKHIKEQVSMT